MSAFREYLNKFFHLTVFEYPISGYHFQLIKLLTTVNMPFSGTGVPEKEPPA